MADKRPSPFSLVLVPAAITLMVTIARLLGELYEWSPTLFGEPKAGGDNAMIGIGWLIFVFGLWFGFRLQRSGQGTGNKGRALLISAIALMVAFGGIFGAKAAGLVTFPDKEHPGEVVGVAYFAGAMVLVVPAGLAMRASAC